MLKNGDSNPFRFPEKCIRTEPTSPYLQKNLRLRLCFQDFQEIPIALLRCPLKPCCVEAFVKAKMYQEDGRLRYIEGVDNGDAPAHDGTFEAGHLMICRTYSDIREREWSR